MFSILLSLPPHSSFFFFHDPAPTQIYTLSLTTLFRSPRTRSPHVRPHQPHGASRRAGHGGQCGRAGRRRRRGARGLGRSEEHTSELQSQSNLVCRLLLEKKKKKKKQKYERSTQATVHK